MKFYNLNQELIYSNKDLGLELVEAKTFDEKEKHVPEVSVSKNVLTIKVGNILHPMTLEHHIEFVLAVSQKNVYVHYFDNEDESVTTFELLDGEVITEVYAYCNLHGLYKKVL